MNLIKILVYYFKFVIIFNSLFFHSDLFAITNSENQKDIYNLTSLVKFGVQNSSQIQAEKLKLTESSININIIKSSFYPSIDFKSIYGYSNSSPTSLTNPWASTLNLQVSQSFYDNGKSYFELEKTKETLKLEKLKFDLYLMNYILEISKNYFEYSKLKMKFDIQKNQFSLIENQLKIIENRYLHGEKTRTDFLRMKAKLRRSELELNITEQQIIKSKLSISNQIGIEIDRLNLSPYITNLQFNSKNDLFLKKINLNHFEIELIKLSIEIEKLNNHYLDKLNSPEFYIDSNINYVNTDFLSKGGLNSDYTTWNWSTFLTIKYNLIDWGKRNNQSIVQLLESERLNYLLENTQLEIKSKFYELNSNLKKELDNFQIINELVNLENSNFETLNLEFRNGKASFLDLINSVDNLTNSKSSLIDSYFDLKIIEFEILHYKGELIETIDKI